jgi:hypothetical protein
VTLQTFLVVSDIQLPPCPKFSTSAHILLRIFRKVSELVKNLKMRKVKTSNSHHEIFILKS